MKRAFLLVSVLFMLFVEQARADYRWIVRVDGGLPAIQRICVSFTCTVSRGLDGSLGQLFLVTSPDSVSPATLVRSLQNQTGVSNVEPDTTATLPPLPLARPLPMAIQDSRAVDFFGGQVWNGYANQPAAQIVNTNQARTSFHVSGSGIVGVIDTGIDPNHPVFQNVLVPGYDFIRDQPGMPSELNDLASPMSPNVNAPPAYVNESTAAVLDDNSAAQIRQYAAFGHGTMVSGVVHMVAPTARIMPLKAFRADGSGYLSDIIRAIYYGTSNGVRVMNMSFSTSNNSKELKRALDQASKSGVIAVASVGNDGQSIVAYPAAFDSVMGVASTDYMDQRSSFSNYGQSLVWVAAPGEAIVSTFPFGTYAASWGTSFSAPFVAGASALLLELLPNCSPTQAASAISNARRLGPEMGYGRLDVYRAAAAITSAR
jgi:subtilisin family serine protease